MEGCVYTEEQVLTILALFLAYVQDNTLALSTGDTKYIGGDAKDWFQDKYKNPQV